MRTEILNLGSAPPSNAYISLDKKDYPEIHLPLRLLACETCWLVQTADYLAPEELFTDEYAYLSSTSESWLSHSKEYCREITEKINLSTESFVVEIASNDGYLLQYFRELDIPCLGIEPTGGTADIARSKGVETVCEFFSESLATDIVASGRKADLIVGNNVFAHVPNLNDFTAGLTKLLKSKGTISLEFPHLLQLVSKNQFDTVYHEHYSYLSVKSVATLLKTHGLEIYNVETLETHGGSVRLQIGHLDAHQVTESVNEVIFKEEAGGLFEIKNLLNLQKVAVKAKHNLLSFLLECKKQEKNVIGLGAAAKGNTFLNFAGITSDLLPFVADSAPSKQGMLLPGSHIPIVSPRHVVSMNVDVGIIFPWNIELELTEQYRALVGPNIHIIPANHFVSGIPSFKI